ncbi:MAG: asparagine synthase (glutamine-hydrolyzing) [Bacteroidia bacterium]|nr:asparagine synthase (glutamine-hydrolyzing) [Bacteroidia bacterium]
MTDTIAHRGPDGEGCWISDDGQTGLGHRRLSIIDLSVAAAQPMADVSERYVITFNGEIYNYLELRKELLSSGVTFRTESDTEVLLALYIQHGEKCVDFIDGMFAFVIRDNKERSLFIARDRFGEKPLYYYKDQKRFVFASEMKAIFAADVKKEYDPKRLHYYLSYNLYQDPNDAGSTFFRDIRQLEPGHFMTVNAEGIVKQTKYWEVSAEKQIQISEADAREKFDFLLRRSIERRLRSDVPVGSSLSGGLDSSTIVLLINKMKLPGQEQKTFSARFKNFDRDEGKYIDLILNSARDIRGFATWPDESAMEDLDRIWFHQEEPFGSASIVAQWAVMKLAKENNVTVLLDGQGADEILGGYRTFFSPLLNRLYANRDSRFEEERKALEGSRNFQYTAGTSTRMMLRYPRMFGTLSATKRLFVKPPAKTVQQPKYNPDFAKQVKEWTHPLQGIYNDDVKKLQKRIFEQSGFSPLLRYADRNSMAFSRELRLPFLEHELVEFCISLPDHFKISNGWTKRLLRDTYAKLLPEDICWRKDKVGFEAPQSVWMNTPQVKASIDTAELELVRSGIVKEGQKFDPWHTLMASKLIKS